jgi:hypothetical protein
MTILAQLNAAARTLALAGLRDQYPHANEAEIRLKLAGLLLGAQSLWGQHRCKMKSIPVSH